MASVLRNRKPTLAAATSATTRYPNGVKRILPAIGFSLSELDDAGINVEAAERLGLPVDAARVGAYGPNVSALREFVRSARQPGRPG